MVTTANGEQRIAGLLRPVTALLLSAAILLTGNGLLGVLGPIRADAEHFSALQIGAMGSFYFAGLMAGCLMWPRVIGTVGHIRAFAALTAIATVTPLAQAVWPTPVAWWVLRAINGLCFAGLFMVIESWLTGASPPESRGRVLGVYTMVNLTVVTCGMQLVSLGEPRSFELFALTAAFYSLAAVPVALAPRSPPTPPKAAKLRLGWLWTVSPAAVVGCFAAGLANSSFWTLSPIYAKGAGMAIGDVAHFLTAVVLGGALLQWPVGRLSDRTGRRPVAIVVCALAALAGLALFGAARGSKGLILATGAAYGAMAFAVYTLCVAHANDLVHRKRAVEVSSGLLLVFSLGAIFGPLVASLMMREYGHGGLFLHSAIAHTLIVIMMAFRARRRPKLPIQRSEPFVMVPRTTPAVFELDPRSEGPEEHAQTETSEPLKADDEPATPRPSS